MLATLRGAELPKDFVERGKYLLAITRGTTG